MDKEVFKMTRPDILKLVCLIEDAICQRVDIDEFEEILPKVSEVLYNRYCKIKPEYYIKVMKDKKNNGVDSRGDVEAVKKYGIDLTNTEQ